MSEQKRSLSSLLQGRAASAFVRSLVGSAGLRILGMGMGFLVGVQLARSLGVEGYGLYGLAMSIISLVAMPAEFGLPQLVTREVAAANMRGDWSAVRQVLGWAYRTTFQLALGILLCGLAVVATIVPDSKSDLIYVVLSGAALIFIGPVTNICSAGVRGMRQVVAGQLPDLIVRPALYSGLIFAASVVAVGDITPKAAMALQVVAVAGAALFSFLMLKRMLPPAGFEPADRVQSIAWLRSSLPMAITEAMRVLQGNISVLVLGVLVASSIVGVYRVAASLSLLLAMPVSLIHIVLAPMVAGLYSEKKFDELRRILLLATLAMVGGVSFLMVPFIFWGDELIAFMFGRDFQGANAILIILGLGSVLGSLWGPGATVLNMTGNERLVARSLGVSLVLLAVISYPMVKVMGGMGAAIANSAAFIIWSAQMWWHVRTRVGIDASVAGLVGKLKGV